MTMKLTEARMRQEAAACTASEFYTRYQDQLVIHDADNILCLDEGIVNMSMDDENADPVFLLWIDGRTAVD
jgi:hypothetical protein